MAYASVRDAMVARLQETYGQKRRGPGSREEFQEQYPTNMGPGLRHTPFGVVHPFRALSQESKNKYARGGNVYKAPPVPVVITGKTKGFVNFEVECMSDDTIENMKAKIFRVIEEPVKFQVWDLMGHRIENSPEGLKKTLEDYGVDLETLAGLKAMKKTVLMPALTSQDFYSDPRGSVTEFEKHVVRKDAKSPKGKANRR